MAEPLGSTERAAPAKTLKINPDLEKPLEFGNHSSIRSTLVWENLFDAVRRDRSLIFETSAAYQVSGIRVAPFGAVVPSKVRIKNDSFNPKAVLGAQDGLTISDKAPRCFCGEALPKFLTEITGLRMKFPR